EPGKIFTQKEAEGEFQSRQEYLYKNIRKFVDESFQDIMYPKPIVR
ncbi:3477_t:CDS:2, partial [Funneliformis geosporum]